MKIQILRLGLDDLGADSTLPFDDPHGLCRLSPETLAAFRGNPFRQSQDEPVQLVGTVDGCAAGTIMFLPGELVVDGKVFSVTWCSGLFVVPEYRKSLLGILLVKEARGSHNIVGGSRLSEMALPIFKRLGWLSIPLTRYIMPRTSRPVLEHVLGPGKAAALLSPLMDLAFILHRWLLKGREKISCANLHCKPADSMPETLDPALANLNHPCGCHRSSRWLNWILQNSFTADPRNRKQLYLVHDRNHRVVAYFITRVKFREHVSHSGFGNLLAGSVIDWGIFASSAVRQEHLWLMGTNALTAEGVDIVEICDASPDADMLFGYRKFGQHWMVLLSNSNEASITKDQIPEWKLCQIDGDSGLA